METTLLEDAAGKRKALLAEYKAYLNFFRIEYDRDVPKIIAKCF